MPFEELGLATRLATCSSLVLQLGTSRYGCQTLDARDCDSSSAGEDYRYIYNLGIWRDCEPDSSILG